MCPATWGHTGEAPVPQGHKVLPKGCPEAPEVPPWSSSPRKLHAHPEPAPAQELGTAAAIPSLPGLTSCLPSTRVSLATLCPPRWEARRGYVGATLETQACPSLGPSEGAILD